MSFDIERGKKLIKELKTWVELMDRPTRYILPTTHRVLDFYDAECILAYIFYLEQAEARVKELEGSRAVLVIQRGKLWREIAQLRKAGHIENAKPWEERREE